jgi:VWFA-related protein
MRIGHRGLSLNPVVFVASILLVAPMLPAQSPAPSSPGGGDARFRAGTQEVLVDAIVVDKKGNFQRDLTREDFKIWEDGKEQKITSFSLEGAGVPGHSSRHFIALVFDTERPGLREEVMQFVDRFAAPDLYLSVFSRVNNREMRLQQAFTPDAGRIKAALRTMEVSTAPPIAGGLRGQDTFHERMSSLAAALSQVRGRKALVLFSAGYYGERLGAVRTEDGHYVRPPLRASPWLTTVDELNAANVSLYAFIHKQGGGHAVDLRGDYYNRPQDPADDHGAATDFIRDLATRTGGKYTPPGTYDLASYLGSVPAEQNDYYLLGYAPSGDSADKPCHKLRVKVDRSGLTVDARDSYCTSSQMARALKPAQRALEARAANGVTGNIAAGLQLSWFYSKPNVAVVDLAMDIDPAAMKMHGKLHGEFSLLGVAYREDRSVAERVGDTVELDFDTPAQLNAFLKTPYHYSKQFRIAPGRYKFRMAVGSGDQAFGSAEKPLEIEPWSGQTMSVSGIALSVKDYPLAGVTAELDSSLLEGPRRLASKARVVVPMGGTQFHTGQNGLFYFEIYEPRPAPTAAGQPTKPPAIRFRILDRATGQEKSDSGLMDAAGWMQAGNPMIPIALNLPVSNLPAGSYTLEVRVTNDGGQDSLVRRADFEVR